MIYEPFPGSCNVYVPSAVVTAPVFSPFMEMVAPGRGSPFVSVTRPLICSVDCCANVEQVAIKENSKMDTIYVGFILCNWFLSCFLRNQADIENRSRYILLCLWHWYSW